MKRLTQQLLSTACAAALLAGSAQAGTEISINLTKSGAPSEAGFTNWEAADNTLPANLSIDGLTLSVVDINAGTTLRSIDRGGNDGYAGTLENLTQTWWGQRATSTGPGGSITIDIAGLAAGSYAFTSWHLDHEDQTGQMKVELSTDDGGSFTDVSSFDMVNFAGGGAGQAAENAAGPIESTFNFTSTGADIQVRFTNTSVDGAGSSGAFSLVNGFSLVVPEPASGAMALVGLGALALLRRRRG